MVGQTDAKDPNRTSVGLTNCGKLPRYEYFWSQIWVGRIVTDIQERLLESKMTEIEQARSWSPRVISKFETLIRSADDQSLYRINPLAFARDRAIAELESIDLFLHATRSGRCVTASEIYM